MNKLINKIVGKEISDSEEMDSSTVSLKKKLTYIVPGAAAGQYLRKGNQREYKRRLWCAFAYWLSVSMY